MSKEIKLSWILIYACSVMLLANHSCASKAKSDPNCEGWVFVADDSLNTHRLHRKIMGRVMETGDTLHLKICKENATSWNVFKADSIFSNITINAKSMTFKRYDTEYTMKILKESKDTLVLGNEWYRLVFRKW